MTSATVLPFVFPEATRAFVASAAQQAVFEWVQRGKGSAIIKAVAGAGKTTTIIKAVNLIPAVKANGRQTSILMLAYNKDIATELKSRVPAHVSAKTFHSLGLSALSKAWGSSIMNKIDDRKTLRIMEREFSELDMSMYSAFVAKLVDLAKQAGVCYLEEDTLAVWNGLIDHYALELDHEDADLRRAVDLARIVLRKSNDSAKQVIDYADMIYLPLLHGMKLWQNDWVFVDEAQDLNPTRRALARKALMPGGRLVAVGDPCQAIYGFTGANSDSLDRIAREFDCIELPLTISYRCPQAVVKAAQQYVPYSQAAETAPMGVVRNVSAGETFRPTDAIICRNTAPLVNAAYSLIGRGIGCRILGREIGDGLVSLVVKMKAKGLTQLEEKLETWRTREVEKANGKGQEQKAQAISDKVEAITVLIDRMPETDRTVPALIRTIKELFEDKGKGVLTLCTAHKSKGQEWPRVFILSPELMPSKWARQAWQKEQENNLIYVAYTRAMEELVFMPEMPEQANKKAA